MNLNTKFKVGQKVFYFDWESEKLREGEIIDVERVATENGQTTSYLFANPCGDACLQLCESDLASTERFYINPESFNRLANVDHDTYTDEVEFDDSDLGKIFCITTPVGKVNLKLTSIKMTSNKVIALFSTFGSKCDLGLGAQISASREAHNVFELTEYDLGERPYSGRLSTVLAIDKQSDDTEILSVSDYSAKLHTGLDAMSLFVAGSF